MANVVEFTDTNFENEVLQASTPVLVDFTATWCGPCKQIKPVVEELATENTGKLLVGALDIDNNMTTTMKYGVMSVPTLILFKNGQPVERVVGFMPKQRLWKKLSPHLN